jgi:hypothetical protein
VTPLRLRFCRDDVSAKYKIPRLLPLSMAGTKSNPTSCASISARNSHRRVACIERMLEPVCRATGLRGRHWGTMSLVRGLQSIYMIRRRQHYQMHVGNSPPPKSREKCAQALSRITCHR